MDKPIDENADLDPVQLASMNSTPQEAEPKTPVPPPQPAAPPPAINRYSQPPASSHAAATPAVASAAVPPPVAPAATAAQPKPAEPPKPAPLPPPESEPTGPVALAPAVVYDADLNQQTTAHLSESSHPHPAPGQSDVVVPAPQPQVAAQPHLPTKQRRPTRHSPAKGVRPVKVFSQSTKHVWKARRYQRQYAVFSIAMIILGAIGLAIAWVAIGSPTDLDSVRIPGQ